MSLVPSDNMLPMLSMQQFKILEHNDCQCLEEHEQSVPEVINFFSCSAELSMKFEMLISFKYQEIQLFSGSV